MKILHFSDTHLGFSEYNKVDPATGLNQRELDFYRAWQQVIQAILEIEPDIVVHAGDLFHTPRPSNRAIRVALEGIQRVSEVGIPWIIISGNHETPRIRTTGSIFESIALFDNVFAAFSSEYQRFRVKDIDFHCIPHCSLTEELEKAFASLQQEPSAVQNVLVTHGAWSGGTYYGMGEFNEQRLPDVEGLLGRRFDYIALGHYHRQVDVKDNASYSGSTERTSLNEHNNACGYLLVDLATGQKQFHQIETRPMKRIPAIDCEGLTLTQIYDKLESASTEALLGAIVNLTLENIENDTFLKLDIRRIDQFFDQTFHTEKQFIRKGTQKNAIAGNSRIEALPVEFERYLSAIAGIELDSTKLCKMGMQYLSTEE